MSFPIAPRRVRLSLALLVGVSALALAQAAGAESLTLTSQVTAVTVYPDMAAVTRHVEFNADAAGAVDLVIPDLPAGALSVGMRFATEAPATVGTFALRTDRVPVLLSQDTPAVAEARAALEAAEAALAEAVTARDRILARAEAAEAQLAFLGAVKVDAGALSPQALADLAGAVGQQALAAREAALTARAEATPADKAVTRASEARDAARAGLEALLAAPEDKAALLVTLDVAQPGPVALDITHYIADAGWRPAYDLRLDDQAQPARLVVDRGALVSQYTGEDWAGVDLTLSTARPSEQAAPSTLYPWLRSIQDPAARSAESGAGFDMALASPAPAMEAAPMATAAADFGGVAVTYHLAAPVSVATGVEDLRLGLDSLSFAPKVVAEAVPSRDATAFVVAEWVNTSGEVLLPGDALMLRQGTLVGNMVLPLIPPGDTTRTGFGALDGVKLARIMPDTSEGDRGVFTTSTERRETAVLRVQNLTDRDWPVRVLDQVPYSEQEDLQIDWTADPAPTETDVEDQRGILAWTFDLPAGETREITLTTRLRWPEGMELQ